MDVLTEFDTVLNFQFQSERGGLRMGLCPGKYAGKDSFPQCVNINESAFGPLEPIISQQCPRYANYGHWGVTAILRSEWIGIIEGWEQLKQHLVSGAMPNESAMRWFTNLEGMKCTDKALQANIEGLIGLIDALSKWLHHALEAEEQVCILGI